MTRHVIVNGLTAIIVLLIAWWIMAEGAKHRYKGEVAEFARAVDLAAFESLAVHTDGRLNSFASHARTMMQYVSGAKKIKGQSPTFSYLDMIFRPGQYQDADMIYVKNKVVRARIADAIASAGGAADPAMGARLEAFIERGLISPRLVDLPEVRAELETLSTDLMRTAKDVQSIDSAMSASNPQALLSTLAIIPPPGQDVMTPWISMGDIGNAFNSDTIVPGLTPDQQGKLVAEFETLAKAWVQEDAPAVEQATASLASTLRAMNPALYPTVDRLEWERWYFSANNLTWIWMIYLLAVAVLLMSVVYRWRGANWLGIGLFLVAFGFHTFAIFLRWYVSGRWPNSNMFEAVTTSVWFGGCGAIVLEILARKTAMRNVFILGAAVSSMFALMCANFMPINLNANISNMMPVLHDVWLYIHTNVIIFSYCLIAMAAVSGLLYLRHRAIGGAADFARVGGAGALVMSGAPGTVGNPSTSASNVSASSAGSIFDGATMVLMELSFILLWTGLVMGAIWADHSWGRPWGWDPKEVFALNTFIVFALLVHVRLKVKDKGLWTALLAVAGAVVMLFNWIIINFQIVGLHSYA